MIRSSTSLLVRLNSEPEVRTSTKRGLCVASAASHGLAAIKRNAKSFGSNASSQPLVGLDRFVPPSHPQILPRIQPTGGKFTRIMHHPNQGANPSMCSFRPCCHSPHLTLPSRRRTPPVTPGEQGVLLRARAPATASRRNPATLSRWGVAWDAADEAAACCPCDPIGGYGKKCKSGRVGTARVTPAGVMCRAGSLHARRIRLVGSVGWKGED